MERRTKGKGRKIKARKIKGREEIRTVVQ